MEFDRAYETIQLTIKESNDALTKVNLKSFFNKKEKLAKRSGGAIEIKKRFEQDVNKKTYEGAPET